MKEKKATEIFSQWVLDGKDEGMEKNHSNAVKISGSSPSNLTSTTAPITCVIFPFLIIINFLLLI